MTPQRPELPRDIPRFRHARVLLVHDDPEVIKTVESVLAVIDVDIVNCTTPDHAMTMISLLGPDLLMIDVTAEQSDGRRVLDLIRDEVRVDGIPILAMVDKDLAAMTSSGIYLGANDFVVTPFRPTVLVRRVQRLIKETPAMAEPGLPQRPSGTLAARRMLEEIEHESTVASSDRRSGYLAVINVVERERITHMFGPTASTTLDHLVADHALDHVTDIDVVGGLPDGGVAILMPETSRVAAVKRLRRLASELTSYPLRIEDDRMHITPAIGLTRLRVSGPTSATSLVQRAAAAAEISASHRDLEPVVWTPRMGEPAKKAKPPWRARLQTPIQIAIIYGVGAFLPFLLMVWLAEHGINAPGFMYVVLLFGLGITALHIWLEAFAAVRPARPPKEPASPYPPASAIIAAYLPNEAATIIDTLESFLLQDYPAELQVILAYNTPKPMPIEIDLELIAAENPRLQLLKVEGSTSKAQNVNAALTQVTGEFVGIFDADHHIDQGSFRRAWRWLSSKADMVQGHCVVRNGSASWVARMVAVEFEAIYAVSHPGRARLHGFGIFGGSNGYWRTSLLRSIRMQGTMLTEDIDSSLRALDLGARMVSDPGLKSRELAPVQLSALWKQRMRWAQGWFQVSMRHTHRAARSPHLTPRQRSGMWWLLGWRELYPWISLQAIPVLVALAITTPAKNQNWFIPVFVLATLFTQSVAPGQTFFAYFLGDAKIRHKWTWFVFYVVVGWVFYAEMKNLIARLAQLKQFSGESDWVVTPRSPSDTYEDGVRLTA